MAQGGELVERTRNEYSILKHQEELNETSSGIIMSRYIKHIYTSLSHPAQFS